MVENLRTTRYRDGSAIPNVTDNTAWGNLNTGATGLELGTGGSNTSAIVASLGIGTYAAKICSDLVLGRYSDWFLPSYQEVFPE